MINIEQQIGFFKIIGKELDRRIECIVIGGSAMLFYGAKKVTKDVDIVFLSRKDMELVKSALEKSGFAEKKHLRKIFRHYEDTESDPIMMEGHNTRFDLFVNEVITMKLTDSIKERVKEVHEFDNFVVKTLSPEDVIMFKCATERERDRDDALELIKKFNINWNIIIEEGIAQTKIGGDVYPVYLFDFLSELKEDLKADIPAEVIKKIRKIGEEIMVKKIKSGKSVRVAKFADKNK